MRRQAIALIAVLALASFAAYAQQTTTQTPANAACGAPTALGDGWTIAKPHPPADPPLSEGTS